MANHLENMPQEIQDEIYYQAHKLKFKDVVKTIKDVVFPEFETQYYYFEEDKDYAKDLARMRR